MSTPLDNLVYCLGLNEASGNAIDASGNGKTFTQQGIVPAATGKISGARGPFTQANYFSRAMDSDMRLVGGSMAWSCWVKRTADAEAIAFKTNDVEYLLYVDTVNTGPMLETGLGGQTWATWPTRLTVGEWHWIFAYVDLPSLKMGISVNNAAPVEVSVPASPVWAFGTTLRVGGGYPNGDNVAMEQLCYWRGRIPEQVERDGLYNGGAAVTFDAFGQINAPATSRLRMDHRYLRPRVR